MASPAADAGRPLGPFGALERLGRDFRFQVVSDPAAVRSLCGSGEEVDLVVVDAAFGAAAEGLLSALRAAGGPPVVVAGWDVPPEVALAFVRLGAADCVSLSGDASALALVALEQIARWRESREQREAEARVRELEQFQQSVLQNLNTALLVVGEAGHIRASNPAAEEILGAGREALRDRPVGEWFRDGPDGETPLARTLRDGSRHRAVEGVVWRGDGTRVPVGVSCAPLFDASGVRRGAVATFQDLTEIVQLQNRVLQTEKMASIGQLAAGVAHEINNPMGFIHANLFQMAEYAADLRRVWGLVEALQKAAAAGSDAPEDLARAAQELAAAADEVDVGFLLSDLAQAIRESQEGSERIRHIVSDLRDFSHQDTAERVLADINQCLDSTASIVWPMMKHLVVLEKEYAELPAVYCYPMQLKQVFMNLLVNAYQAIEERLGEGGGTGTIWLRTDWRDAGVAVRVRDTGAGIPREHLDRIFDPFFTTKKVGAGTGLGLSTSYSIVKRHGGWIAADSRPGEGTEFRLWLPAEAGPGAEESGRGDGGDA